MKIRFLFKSFEATNLKKISTELQNLCLELGCTVSGTVALPVRIKKYCVLRSPHIDKDSREAFELRIHKHFLDISIENSAMLDKLLSIEVPAGILCSLQVLS
jgi:small subunit ribosomal protein S10